MAMNIDGTAAGAAGRQGTDELRQQALELINKMRNTASQAQAPTEAPATERADSFTQLFNNAIKEVNALQNQAEGLRTAYELGDPQVNLTQVVLASQSASLGFNFMLNVRNRAINAYKEIMAMPI